MELIAADYAPSNETNGYRAEIVESRRNMVAGRYRNRFGHPARHDQCAGWDFLAPRRQVICQHHDCRQRIAEHGSAGGMVTISRFLSRTTPSVLRSRSARWRMRPPTTKRDEEVLSAITLFKSNLKSR